MDRQDGQDSEISCPFYILDMINMISMIKFILFILSIYVNYIVYQIIEYLIAGYNPDNNELIIKYRETLLNGESKKIMSIMLIMSKK